MRCQSRRSRQGLQQRTSHHRLCRNQEPMGRHSRCSRQGLQRRTSYPPLRPCVEPLLVQNCAPPPSLSAFPPLSSPGATPLPIFPTPVRSPGAEARRWPNPCWPRRRSCDPPADSKLRRARALHVFYTPLLSGHRRLPLLGAGHRPSKRQPKRGNCPCPLGRTGTRHNHDRLLRFLLPMRRRSD